MRIHRTDLMVHALYHRFVFAVLTFEYFDELLGADIVGKRPQALSGSAG
jgi:hypothetical protein